MAIASTENNDDDEENLTSSSLKPQPVDYEMTYDTMISFATLGVVHSDQDLAELSPTNTYVDNNKRNSFSVLTRPKRGKSKEPETVTAEETTPTLLN